MRSVWLHDSLDAYPGPLRSKLGPQGVTFSLKSPVIKPGAWTVGSGKGSPLAEGRAVQLQVERAGAWYRVATTHENASGALSFTIKGATVGSRDYRAVASDFAGYLQYGRQKPQNPYLERARLTLKGKPGPFCGRPCINFNSSRRL